MENMSNQNTQELVEEIKERMDNLELEARETLEEVKTVKEELQSNEEIKEKSVDELLGVEHVEGNIYAVEVDGEKVEFERTETKYNALTVENTDEEINAEYERLGLDENIYNALQKEQKVELLNYFLEREALQKEMEKMQEEFQAELKELNDSITEESLKTKTDIINLLNQKIELYKKYGYEKAIKQTENIIEEITMSINLTPFKKSASRVKNPSKVFTQYKTNFKDAEKRFFKRLEKNRTYRFVKSETLVSSLEKEFGLTEDQATLFLYVFFNSIKNKDIVERYAVCISEVIRNIMKPECLSEEQQKEFKIAMLDIVGMFVE